MQVWFCTVSEAPLFCHGRHQSSCVYDDDPSPKRRHWGSSSLPTLDCFSLPAGKILLLSICKTGLLFCKMASCSDIESRVELATRSTLPARRIGKAEGEIRPSAISRGRSRGRAGPSPRCAICRPDTDRRRHPQGRRLVGSLVMAIISPAASTMITPPRPVSGGEWSSARDVAAASR